jgi:hypothetical protein
METTGIEPATSWLQTSERPDLSDASKEVKATQAGSCTPCCTGNEDQANDDPFAALVASLSPEDRRHLSDLLECAGQAPCNESEPLGRRQK